MDCLFDILYERFCSSSSNDFSGHLASEPYHIALEPFNLLLYLPWRGRVRSL